ncbi:hypothetical protein C5Y93_18630 [Blastopirellula marina]|uniref:Uncharacterized protein n=1 Tax=Blastopirellula marina TaxID=124 RepID=A0A2S8GIZ6_9BACT|nr:hypothetical protein C5Y93_18630 [Blastopirellula marina]
MRHDSINREELYRKLARTAQIRSVLTMLIQVIILLPVGALALVIPNDSLKIVVFLTCFFGGGLLVSWLITQRICIPRVRCPHCGGTLWHCGNNAFKHRKMRLRSDATCCPHCQAPIR